MTTFACNDVSWFFSRWMVAMRAMVCFVFVLLNVCTNVVWFFILKGTFNFDFETFEFFDGTFDPNLKLIPWIIIKPQILVFLNKIEGWCDFKLDLNLFLVHITKDKIHFYDISLFKKST
jgi:hypothetical protein